MGEEGLPFGLSGDTMVVEACVKQKGLDPVPIETIQKLQMEYKFGLGT